MGTERLFAMVNVNWPTAVAGEADIVSSVSASACHIGGPIDVNPGELTLVYSITSKGCSGNSALTLLRAFKFGQ